MAKRKVTKSEVLNEGYRSEARTLLRTIAVILTKQVDPANPYERDAAMYLRNAISSLNGELLSGASAVELADVEEAAVLSID